MTGTSDKAKAIATLPRRWLANSRLLRFKDRAAENENGRGIGVTLHEQSIAANISENF
jgi:hypothetical protein